MTQEFAIGSDGNYLVVGDTVRHREDYAAFDRGLKLCLPGTVEAVYREEGRDRVRVRYPKWDDSGWTRGGGAIIDSGNSFRKVTREEKLAERFL